MFMYFYARTAVQQITYVSFRKVPFCILKVLFYSQEDTFYASLEKQTVNNTFRHIIVNILTLKQLHLWHLKSTI